MTVQRGIYLWSDLSLKKTDTIIEHLFIFFYFLSKNGFSFSFFMFTILAWPISLHILMYLLFPLLRLRFIDMYTILKFLLEISFLQKNKSLKHITFNQIGLKNHVRLNQALNYSHWNFEKISTRIRCFKSHTVS